MIVGTVPCRACGGSVPGDAALCPQCGTAQSSSAMQSSGSPGAWGRAIWSGLLSLVMPGLGQVHARSWRLGVLLLAITMAATVALDVLSQFRPEPTTVAVSLALIAAFVLFGLGAAADAVRRTRRSIRFSRPRWFSSTHGSPPSWWCFSTLLSAWQ